MKATRKTATKLKNANTFQSIRSLGDKNDSSSSSSAEEEVIKKPVELNQPSESQILTDALLEECKNLPEYTDKFCKIASGINSVLNF